MGNRVLSIGLAVAANLWLLGASAARAGDPECFTCFCFGEVRFVDCCVPIDPPQPAVDFPEEADTAIVTEGPSFACFPERTDASQCSCPPDVVIVPCDNPPPCEDGERRARMPIGFRFVPEGRPAGDCGDCPTTEEGAACFDGVNNDGLQDELVDCDDPDCADACNRMAPAASNNGMLALAVALAGLGAVALRRSTLRN